MDTTGKTSNTAELFEPSTERTPLFASRSSSDFSDNVYGLVIDESDESQNRGEREFADDAYGLVIDESDDSQTEGERDFSLRRQLIQADHLSARLLAIDDDDLMMENLILHETLNVEMDTPLITLSEREQIGISKTEIDDGTITSTMTNPQIKTKIFSMTGICVLAFSLITASLWISVQFIGPPNQPVGPYQLIERQVRYN